MASCVSFEPIGECIGNAAAAALSSDAKVNDDCGIELPLESEREITDDLITVIGGNDQTLLRDAIVKGPLGKQAECASVYPPNRDDLIQAGVAGKKLGYFPRLWFSCWPLS